MRVAMLGATGRTGALIVKLLLLHGHQVTVLVRAPERLREDFVGQVTMLTGDSRDPDALRRLVAGREAVLSALGPTAKDPKLHQESATALIRVMQEEGVRRFVGVSGAGIDVAGDEKGLKARLISRIIRRLGGAMAKDKAAEYRTWAASNVEWTLVRPQRLKNGRGTGRTEHHAHRPTRASSIRRMDLAGFLVETLEFDLYLRQAPFVGQAHSLYAEAVRVSGLAVGASSSAT